MIHTLLKLSLRKEIAVYVAAEKKTSGIKNFEKKEGILKRH